MSCVSEQGWDAEVLVVDDGSKDDTAAIVERWMATHPRLHMVKNPGNKGKGYSVRNGLLQSAGEIVMFTDADLSSPMEEAERLIAAIQDGADVAIGSRWDGPHPPDDLHPSRSTASSSGRCFNWVTRRIMGLPFKGHTQCGSSKPSNAKQPRSSSGSRPSSAGASILRFSSSRAS